MPRNALFSALLVVAHLASAGLADEGPVAPLWQEFESARAKGQTAILPDFSYAGYEFSNRSLPQVSDKPVFNVTEYGARPNDADYDQAGIQAAVDAAEQRGGGVVYLPAGRYLIGEDRDRNKRVAISASNIILKGSGSGEGGTEIFMNERRIGARQFVFRPQRQRSRKLAVVTGAWPRGGFEVEVEDADSLDIGETVVLRQQSEEFTRQYFGNLPLAPQWRRLFGPRGGMEIREIHTVAGIDGKRVTFANPMHLDLLSIADHPFELHSFPTIRECGVEDVRFVGNWASYPEEFVHHKDAIHDSGWCALTMENVENCWIRDCEFRDWNECISLDGAYKTTVENVSFTGKKGHTSVLARSGYGVLIKDCRFDAGHHHGPGVGYGAVSTVVANCRMQVDQNIDSHSGQPIATLYDNVQGGVFKNLGGPHEGLPHHGKHLVFWNFEHRSREDFHYNFWDVHRRRNHTIAKPVFVGFRANTHVTFANEGANSLPGATASPRSLFKAQLALRRRGESTTAAKDAAEPGPRPGARDAYPAGD